MKGIISLSLRLCGVSKKIQKVSKVREISPYYRKTTMQVGNNNQGHIHTHTTPVNVKHMCLLTVAHYSPYLFHVIKCEKRLPLFSWFYLRFFTILLKQNKMWSKSKEEGDCEKDGQRGEWGQLGPLWFRTSCLKCSRGSKFNMQKTHSRTLQYSLPHTGVFLCI